MDTIAKIAAIIAIVLLTSCPIKASIKHNVFTDPINTETTSNFLSITQSKNGYTCDVVSAQELTLTTEYQQTVFQPLVLLLFASLFGYFYKGVERISLSVAPAVKLPQTLIFIKHQSLLL